MLVLPVDLQQASRENVLFRRSLPVYRARSCLATISLELPTGGRLLLAFEFFEGNDATLLGTSFPVRSDNADCSSRVFAVSPCGAALWLVFLAEQMV
jgi:hypothetical protein